MITECGAEIDAPAAVVWDVFSDVERWPEWTASVTRLVALDSRELAVGNRFEIKQPRMPKLVWEVTEVVPGASWTWVQRSPGGLTVARHDVSPVNPVSPVSADSQARTRIDQRLEQRGPVGALVGLLMRSMTKRYLELEAEGLKARCERLHRLDGPSA